MHKLSLLFAALIVGCGDKEEDTAVESEEVAEEETGVEEGSEEGSEEESEEGGE